MDKIILWVILIAVIALLVVFTVGLFVDFNYQRSKVEIERYTINCEITQMAYAEESVSERHSQPTYRMGVRCDDFAHTFIITNEQFASYVVGELIEVEVVVYEYKDGKQTTAYNLIS